MKNTLNWDIKPIALPKINSNLLSAVSLILLLTVAFITASVIAGHCSIEEQARNNALLQLGLTSAVFSVALLSGNFVAITVAAGWVGAESKTVDIAQQALDRCNKKITVHRPAVDAAVMDVLNMFYMSFFARDRHLFTRRDSK